MRAVRRAPAVALLCTLAGWTLCSSVVSSHNPTTTTVRFNREIAAIVARKCVACHGERTMAMPLITYEQARPWAVAIKEQILARRMPPWPGERGYGTFANDFGLTSREVDFIVSWAEGGAPSGDGPAPVHVDHGGHWMLGEPDEVLTPAGALRIAARRPPSFERVVVQTANADERWVRALDFKPQDRRVVRAAFFSVVETGQVLGGWTPSSQAGIVPPGTRFRLPPRARIAMDVFYAGIAEDAIDQPTLALYVTAEPPSRSAVDLVLKPAVAATADASRRVASATLERDSTVVAIRPESPLTTRSLEVRVNRPDGSSDVLLWVRHHRPNWPTSYVMRRPVSLPAGTRLDVILYAGEAQGDDAIPSVTFTLLDGPPDSTVARHVGVR